MLENRIAVLKKQLHEHEELASKPLSDPTTVYIGDGYFVSMNVKDAKDFLRRKIEGIKKDLATLNQLCGLNDEGLPVLDILEELDDNDQVTNVKVSQAGTGNAAGAMHLSRGLRTFPSDNYSDEISNSKRDNASTETASNSSNSYSEQNPRITEIASSDSNNADEGLSNRRFDLEENLIPSSIDGDDDDIQYIEDVSDYTDDSKRFGEDESNGEFRDVDPSDILELELMEEDIDEENIDFNFDDVEEDDEIDVIDDSEDEIYDDYEDYEWEGGSLFPQDEMTRKLLEAHFSKSSEVPVEEDKDAISKKKSKGARVHFADDVDVREFETNSSERKQAPVQQVSRFRAMRQTSTNGNIGASSAQRSSMPPSQPDKPTLAKDSAQAAAAAAAIRSPQNSKVHGSVAERETPRSPVRTSSSIIRSPSSTNRVSIKTISKLKSPVIAKNGASAASSKESGLKQELTSNQKDSSQDTATTVETIRDKLHDLTVKDNKPTASDDKEEATMNIREKIQVDAEKLFENSFVPDEDFLRLHDQNSPTYDHSETPEITRLVTDATQENAISRGKDGIKHNSTDSKIPVVSSVMERELSEDSELDGYEDDNEINMTEIKHEYQRLRQKLIYQSGGFKKNEQENAVEPITADGAPKKVSRFKAARIN